MNWFAIFRRRTEAGPCDLRERYKHFRELGRSLNVELIKQLPKSAVPECGKKLGIFKSGTLILNNDDEIAVLYDYCLYHYRRGGKNVIERHLERSPPPPESSEMQLLQAMLTAYFSLFRIEAIQPHRGAALRDLVTEKTLDLLDLSLSETGMPGMILAGRIITLPEFTMSSGAMIPVPEPVLQEKIGSVIRTFKSNTRVDAHRPFTAGREASFAAQVLRIALHAGGEDNTFFSDIDH